MFTDAAYAQAESRQSVQNDRKPVAFVHMRWERDDTEGWPILYCYDIQLEGHVQRKGLGRCADWWHPETCSSVRATIRAPLLSNMSAGTDAVDT